MTKELKDVVEMLDRFIDQHKATKKVYQNALKNPLVSNAIKVASNAAITDRIYTIAELKMIKDAIEKVKWRN